MADNMYCLADTIQRVLLLGTCTQINNVTCYKDMDDIILTFKTIKCCIEPRGTIYMGCEPRYGGYTFKAHLSMHRTHYIIDVDTDKGIIAPCIEILCNELAHIYLVKICV